jgi:hypothetical protein
MTDGGICLVRVKNITLLQAKFHCDCAAVDAGPTGHKITFHDFTSQFDPIFELSDQC